MSCTEINILGESTSADGTLKTAIMLYFILLREYTTQEP